MYGFEWNEVTFYHEKNCFLTWACIPHTLLSCKLSCLTGHLFPLVNVYIGVVGRQRVCWYMHGVCICLRKLNCPGRSQIAAAIASYQPRVFGFAEPLREDKALDPLGSAGWSICRFTVTSAAHWWSTRAVNSAPLIENSALYLSCIDQTPLKSFISSFGGITRERLILIGWVRLVILPFLLVIVLFIHLLYNYEYSPKIA